jgi:hypothetical protein
MIHWREIGSFLEKSVTLLFGTHEHMVQNEPVGVIRHENTHHCTKIQVSPASQSREIRILNKMTVTPFIQIWFAFYENGHGECPVPIELHLQFKFQVDTTSLSGVLTPWRCWREI